MHRSTGEILARVAGGEEVIVARNGIPIARLSPIGRPLTHLAGAGEGQTRQVVSDAEILEPVMEEM